MILVTGGTGFVGPRVVHALRAAGEDVRLLVRKPGSKAARTAASLGCDLAQGDMTDAASLQRAVKGCEAVVHLVSPPPFAARQVFERVMIQGSRDLLAAAKQGAVRRFVLMSALGTDEDTKDLTGYYASKWDAEQAVRESGIDHVIFRPSFVFGPGGGVLGNALKAVRFSPVVPVVAAERKLQPIWIEDVAAFFARSVSLEDAPNRTFDLVGPDVVTWPELWTRIERVLGKRRADVRVPTGLLRGVAKVGELLPPTRGATEAVTMLDHGDNVGDLAPAVEAFGIQPIGLTEQIRRAVA